MENEVKEEVKVETKKKGNGLFTVFACVMTGVIVFLASNLGDKASKVVDPETNSGNTTTSNVASNVESNVASNVESNVASNAVSNVTSNVESNVTSNTATTQVTVRTYRFFGYTENSGGPDMYTTLKLYSNKKYELFVNKCSGVQKYTGTYTETDKSVVLAGEIQMTLAKENGDNLKFDYDKVLACGNSGGSFGLENTVLGSANKADAVGTKTYRFFGYTETGSGADMYTSLKLYPDNKYELFVNVCSGVKKYSGTYTETSTGVTLNGEINVTLAKLKDNSLQFDFNKIKACGNSGGSFALESDAIGK